VVLLGLPQVFDEGFGKTESISKLQWIYCTVRELKKLFLNKIEGEL